MKKIKKIISLITSVAMISQVAIMGKPMVAKASEVNVNFAKGADVGWLPQMEAGGFTFKDDNGNKKDCLQILKEHGIDSIRLRTWVNPSNDPQAGHCSAQETVDMAVRAKNMGFKIMIDFHYSDSWADPSQQNIPAAWKNDTLDQMKTDLYNYTHDVMTKLKDAGVTPEWVQVGNEINPGMLLPMGSFNNPSNLAQLINSGYDAVKAVSPASKVIIHRANGYDNANFRNFFDTLQANGTKYDVIGVSYYPEKDYTSSIDELGNNLNDMASRYGKEVMVVEVGGDCSVDEVNVHNMVVAVENKVAAVPNGKGIGVFYWEPEGAKSWSGYSWSAWNGNDGKSTDGQPTKALDAFLPGEAELDPYPVTGIALDKSNATVEVGNTVTLNATLAPSNATYKGVIFSSSDEKVAKVNASTGVVTGLASGIATITATSYDQHKTATCQVTVVASSNLIKNPGFELDKEDWTVAGNTASVTIDKDAHTGGKALHYYNGDFEATQTITGLENGWYKLSAWTSGGGGEKLSEIFAVNGAGQRSSQAFTNTGWNVWNQSIVNNIEVTDGKITIGANVKMNDNGGQWGNIDDFVLVKNDSTSLKDLQVNGVTIKNFDSNVTSYDVVLPAGTTAVPTVTAASLYPSATTVVTPAFALPGHTTVTVNEGTATKVYSINFTVETTNPVQNPGFESSFDNWTISDSSAVSLSNDKHSGAKALGYWKGTAYELKASQKITGLKNGVYTLSAWSQGASDSCTNQIFAEDSKGNRLSADIKNTGWAVWSQSVIKDIIVTDGTITIGSYLNAPAGYWGSYDDFELVQTSTVIPKNTDATLSNLKIGGQTVSNFNPDTTTYNVKLPSGTTSAPEVLATVKDTGKAKVIVTPALNLPGTTKIVVTAEDGITTKTYTVNFTVDVTKVVSVSLNKTTDSLNVGGTDTLVATVNPSNATNKNVTWKSSNAEVAKVDANGKVTAVGVGTAVVTATTLDGSKTASCTVNVSIPIINVLSVSLNKTTDTLIVGETDTLSVTVNPSNATNKVVKWASSNNKVVTVDSNGKITAVEAGNAVITATTNNGVTANCNVSVKEKAQPTKPSSQVQPSKPIQSVVTSEKKQSSQTITLPKTGGADSACILGFGALISLAGVGMIRKKK
ncbi:glycosyl hydrolase 53 family protein [Inconstantimicrobium mannanitabidum]|uniref:Uncharacterized protein n=1 Tax=Inconstantimicrobium mannanitabidum TaxID=1604901 RepID=A0ACB5RET0_9CLOT|nr:glycosyl hydrolase 53 family protein [Clostridium sp. TW13]GKX67626.1 hypothetical protein rsdtw13_28840 [Clostridium sp. TW13]